MVIEYKDLSKKTKKKHHTISNSALSPLHQIHTHNLLLPKATFHAPFLPLPLTTVKPFFAKKKKRGAYGPFLYMF